MAEQQAATDPELARVVAAWPIVPEPIKAAIAAPIGSAVGAPQRPDKT